MTPRSLIPFSLLGAHFIRPVRATVGSVCQDPGYALLRTCAGGCVACDSRQNQIGVKIGCGGTPQIECWCRTDLLSLATSALSDCVSRSCTSGGWEGDYSSAVHFYTSYCQEPGFTAGGSSPTTVAATTTGVSMSSDSIFTSSGSGASATGLPASSDSTSRPSGSVSSTTGDPILPLAMSPISTFISSVSSSSSYEPSHSSSPAASNKNGLGRSDIIALAVGLGVGTRSGDGIKYLLNL